MMIVFLFGFVIYVIVGGNRIYLRNILSSIYSTPIRGNINHETTKSDIFESLLLCRQ
jgi:type III secretory pathway component EscT